LGDECPEDGSIPADGYGGDGSVAAVWGEITDGLRPAAGHQADSLDISWLRDENEERSEDLPEPAVLAAAVTELEGAIGELQAILAELSVG
jgi:hypothetical protein